ncbi:phage holin family protein [uncultured Erythrobacter sp.]|uniref:phage holin family protein n=1 Tax=uncultured Erythrobacter sp. TaxID=263913 RepID=UPI002633BADC|nr:phage holin family protein [uncultured Erythrobacter sp.]
MDGNDRQTGAEPLSETAPEMPDLPSDGPAQHTDPETEFEEGLFEEVSTLIDDGRNYAEAELAFQKTRAKLAGRSVGVAALAIALALILLHIAFLALAVGLVIALAPLVTIWGAIAIVVGGLLLLVVLLGRTAYKRAKTLSGLFSKPEDV